MRKKLQDMKRKAMDRLCIWMMTFASRHRPQLLVDHVMGRALELGARATMATLDREGLAHCYVCPQRFGLRKLEERGGYACPQHVPRKEEKAGKTQLGRVAAA